MTNHSTTIRYNADLKLRTTSRRRFFVVEILPAQEQAQVWDRKLGHFVTRDLPRRLTIIKRSDAYVTARKEWSKKRSTRFIYDGLNDLVAQIPVR